MKKPCLKKSCLTAMVLGLSFFASPQAFSQSQMANAIDGPRFLPSGKWVVQPNQMSEGRGLKNIDLPCMMAASYDNGYSLRFSGASGKILAMAIDFRQDVFTQGRKYPAQLIVGKNQAQRVTGTAFSKNALVFNMRNVSGMYGALAGAEQMGLSVEGNPMVFQLSNMAGSLKDLDMCHSGTPSGNIEQASASATMPTSTQSPMTQAPSMGVPMGYDNKNKDWNTKVTPVPARVSREIKKTQQANGATWQARAGDDMKATLEGWASRAGTKLDWQATGPSTLVADITVQGSFEEAVQALMARHATVLGLDANMRGAGAHASAPTRLHSVSTSGSRAVSSSSAISSMSSMQSSRTGSGGGRWSAATGTSLEKALQDWSKKAGVELVWESAQGFAVRRSVSTGGSYEDALQSLLGQFKDQKIRPQAQLNNDPNTGRRILFVQSSRV